MTNETTLTPGAYKLPNNCKAFVRNGMVIVSRKWIADDTPRCRDCKHCIRAKSKYNQYYASPVCDMQPKTNRGYNNPEITSQKRFYSVRPSDAACDKYEPRNTNPND
nr:MAG TPA: hypothetical protein [Caudoviricetes sp.]